MLKKRRFRTERRKPFFMQRRVELGNSLPQEAARDTSLDDFRRGEDYRGLLATMAPLCLHSLWKPQERREPLANPVRTGG